MLLTTSHEVKRTINLSRCTINMRKNEFEQNSLFMKFRTFKKMKIVLIKICITYGEHETYTYMQDSYHEQATRNTLVLH